MFLFVLLRHGDYVLPQHGNGVAAQVKHLDLMASQFLPLALPEEHHHASHGGLVIELVLARALVRGLRQLLLDLAETVHERLGDRAVHEAVQGGFLEHVAQ